MTLYLLFEQLEAGKLSLDTELAISTSKPSYLPGPVRV